MKFSKDKHYKGAGFINKLIDKLPVELHIPSYNFCGPGTKLSKRLARGDKGINLLDEACKEHDIAYSLSKDTKTRNTADNILANQAWDRVKSPDSTIGEKLAALSVAGIMKSKSKLGMGIRIKKRNKNLRNKIGKGLNRLNRLRKRRVLKKKRVIPTPKIGGFLPLLFPILGALGALGKL